MVTRQARADSVGESVANDLVVETRGLTKRYPGGVLAVDGLSLNVRRGEIYGFLGPNGAGKTTTLRMLVGLIRPTAGSAVVAGHPPGSRAGLAKIGCVVENASFYPYMSGLDNLRVVARGARVPDSQVEAALDEVDLTEAARNRYGRYSRGQKQRLTWEKLDRIFTRWIPVPRTLHPYPSVRFDARIQGGSRMR